MITIIFFISAMEIKTTSPLRNALQKSDLKTMAIPRQAEFFDYDRDGDLDVYIVTAAMIIPNKNAIRMRKNDGTVINTDRLYRNDGIDPKTRLPVFP